MKRHSRHGLVGLAFSAAMATLAFLAGCGATAWQRAPATTQALHRPSPAFAAIAQMGHGGDAHFELCRVDACPKPTLKTRAVHGEGSTAPISTEASLPAPAHTRTTLLTRAAPVPPIRTTGEPPEAPPAPEVKTVVVPFASGSALLTASVQRKLAMVVSDARRAHVIEIRGRTDELGSAALNEALARDRALAVRDYLRAQDLSDAITVHLSFKGSCCYVAGNDTVEGRAANRRVEIEWLPAQQMAQRTIHERN